MSRSYRTHPLDLELLKRLPTEGSMLGFHTIALTVSRLVPELNKDLPEEAWLNHSQLHGRMAAMKSAGYVVAVPVQGIGSGLGWQRTLAGELHYEEETGESIAGEREEK